MVLGWMGALALKFATGEWVEGNRVRVDYFDPPHRRSPSAPTRW